MGLDEELAAAVGGRAHWRLEGGVAIYAPPAAVDSVRLRPYAVPTRRERFTTAIVRGGVAQYAAWWPSADRAVRWAERARLG